ncbi:MAG: hypothetical protein EAZ60_14470 [Oscillatoriales cyanobacterium]|nr:MAG: hypothetical protein EAZ60_14470 [Oscillatoriales cyanobacterium]
MMKYVCYLLLLICFCCAALPAEASASVCRNYQGREICIVDIKRSAKNYYNCRSHSTVKQDGTVLAFGQNNPGEFVCRFFNKK